MKQGTLLLSAAGAALHLLGTAGACPLHLTEEGGINTRELNNERRLPPPSECRKTAIEKVRVFNGEHFGLPRTVCLDDGKIVHTEKCRHDDDHDGSGDNDKLTVVDGHGKYLIPGLIDNHLHLRDVQSLEDFTSYGISTAMHTNCGNYTQCAINQKQSAAGGIASFFYAGHSAVGNGSAHSATDPTRPRDTLIYPDTDVVDFVSYQFNNGSDFHKITAEVNGPSTEQQVAMVHAAHETYQAETFTHASAISSYEQAVVSQTDAIQHVPDDGLLSDEIISRIVSQKQSVTPTLNVFEYAYRDPLLQHYFSVVPGSNRTLGHAETNARKLYQAGVPLLAGTDAVGVLAQTMPNGTVARVEVPWGLTLHYELQNLVRVVGMTPAEAINAATREPARWHPNMLGDRGVVEVGKRADLLLLSSDPLEDVANTLDYERAWVGGVEVQGLVKGAVRYPF